ncbi:MAG TPA: ribonuclease P protein component [candidate division CPR3 bacterium]|uniref:Ribonuclease P protein component n=1 Tax=candidate division CPR3 bacterium TaxID=2268181 RepID=A0A7C1T285_UNCC3|nr:ribonuclease P protein component [candidate division CPR3 bacterium]
MLAAQNRLSKKTDFDAVLRGRARFTSKALYMKARPNKREVSRIGIMISKKVAKSAVTRNRIRRIIREEIGERIGDTRRECDMVFVGLPGLEKLSATEIRETTAKLIKEARVLC